MRCPKCQYISFDSGDKCRNCGYDFSLAIDIPPQDLPIQDGSEPLGPFTDFALNETPNLPLFSPDGDPDAPLVTPSATPRAPLAVRRTAPAAPRPRVRRPEPDTAPRLALDTADMPIVPERPPIARAIPADPRAAESSSEIGAATGDTTIASAGARLMGGAIDFALIGGIDFLVVYFTLRLCDLTFPEIGLLPKAPLLAFLALLNGGYVSTFVAAGGQTLGKMAAGTRVVSADPAAPASERVPFGQSFLRAAGYLVSALPLGLGFLPAVVGQERRALHDRLADTRVVRA